MIFIGERINTGFKDVKQAVMDKNGDVAEIEVEDAWRTLRRFAREAEITEDEVGNDALGRCVRTVFLSLRFPPAASSATVAYPLIFQPKR